MCGKADTVHSAQGVTVGRGKALQQCLFKWSLKAEHRTPGLFYTGASRAKDITCFALDGPLSIRDAQSIGVSHTHTHTLTLNVWLPLHNIHTLVGQGERAHAAREAMDTLAKQSDAQIRTSKDLAQNRTFEAGIHWFCRYVKDKVQADPRMNVDAHWTQQLNDVAAVCDQWLAALPN